MVSKERTANSPPDAGRVVESLRDTGYDFNTAVADIVDNSIAAGATSVWIDFNFSSFDDQPYLKVTDNGCGMDEAGLINALRYGSKKRADEKSLGKFGMGLKTASTAFCRAISLVSKVEGDATIRKAVLDLDHIISVDDWQLRLPEPTVDDEEELGVALEASDSGTVVTWTKMDRLPMKTYVRGAARQKAFDKLCAELSFHLSAIYCRFLDQNDTRAENVCIWFNGSELKPWDPFCKTEKYTKRIGPETPLEIKDENGKLVASATLQAYVIPRPEDFSTSEARDWGFSNNIYGRNDLQGFYVYRENRLIQMGGWFNMFVMEPHASYSRIEFSFDHRLDDNLKIDIKKSRILLAHDLKEVLKTDYLPGPRKAALDRYKHKEAAAIKAGTKTIHDSSNRIIDKCADEIGAVKPDSIDEAKGTVTVINMDPKKVTYNIEIVKPENPEQKRVVPSSETTEGILWEPIFTDGINIAVKLNESHDFYRKIYYPNRNNGSLIIGLDSLFWSLANTELKTADEKSQKRYKELRYQVSHELIGLLENLPDPEIDDSEEKSK